jgi:hypothetical protein
LVNVRHGPRLSDFKNAAALIHAKVDLKVDILYTMLDKLPAFFLPGRYINQNGHDMIHQEKHAAEVLFRALNS